MYAPYLRGKQEEQFAILEISQPIFDKKKILPIFEPANASLASVKRYAKMCGSARPFVLIVNPQIPLAPSQTEVVDDMVNSPELAPYSNYLLGFILDGSTTLAAVKAFLRIAPNLEKVLIHRGEFANPAQIQALNTSISFHAFKENRVTNSYITAISKGTSKILLRDGFNRLARNADYNGTEHFSDLHLTYSGSGYHGFGDYLIIGDFYQPSGGPANAVAIHLSHEGNKGVVSVSHFVSTNTTGTGQVAGKFGQALGRLITFSNANGVLNTVGLQDFRTHHASGHFPGLGKVKRFSMKHHMELTASLI